MEVSFVKSGMYAVWWCVVNGKGGFRLGVYGRSTVDGHLLHTDG